MNVSGPRLIRGRRNILFASVAILTSRIATAAGKFECEKLRPDAQRKPSYDIVEGDERCEGFYVQQVAGPYLELVSLARGNDKAAPKGQAVALRASAAAGRVVVQPLVQGVPYRVDLLNGPNGARWVPDQMLEVTGLRFAHLGFLAEIPATAPKRLDFVPTLVGTSTQGSKCVALIRSSVRTKEMQWRVVSKGQSEASWQKLEGGAVDTWGLARVELTPDDKGTIQVVQIQARREDGFLLPILQFGVQGP